MLLKQIIHSKKEVNPSRNIARKYNLLHVPADYLLNYNVIILSIWNDIYSNLSRISSSTKKEIIEKVFHMYISTYKKGAKNEKLLLVSFQGAQNWMKD